MIIYIKFQSLVNKQEDARLMLGHNASNLIKHIDSSLQFTDVTDSILMPLKTSLITFKSDVGTLDKAEI